MKPKRRAQRREQAVWAEYAVIDICRISCSSYPKWKEDDDDIVGLAASIAKHGLLQPILVRRSPLAGQYILIGGGRRLKACKRNGMAQIQAMVLECDEQGALACWMEEHLTRRLPSFLEEAERIRRAGAERVKMRFALPQALLDERLNMLTLPETVKAEIVRQGLSLEQATPLLRIHDEKKQIEAAELIAQRGLGARQARRLVCGPDHGVFRTAGAYAMSDAISAIHETLKRIGERGIETRVGMHSREDGVCVQIYLKKLRL